MLRWGLLWVTKVKICNRIVLKDCVLAIRYFNSDYDSKPGVGYASVLNFGVSDVFDSGKYPSVVCMLFSKTNKPLSNELSRSVAKVFGDEEIYGFYFLHYQKHYSAGLFGIFVFGFVIGSTDGHIEW